MAAILFIVTNLLLKGSPHFPKENRFAAIFKLLASWKIRFGPTMNKNIGKSQSKQIFCDTCNCYIPSGNADHFLNENSVAKKADRLCHTWSLVTWGAVPVVFLTSWILIVICKMWGKVPVALARKYVTLHISLWNITEYGALMIYLCNHPSISYLNISEPLVAVHNKGRKHQKLLDRIQKDKKLLGCSVFVRGFKKESDIENDIKAVLGKYGCIKDVYVDKEKVLIHQLSAELLVSTGLLKNDSDMYF